MRLRNWLFAGTSLTLISMAPPSFAQDAPADLPQACIDQGFTTLDECIAAQPAGEAAPAPEEAAPASEAPVEEAAPPAEEPAPAPEEAAPAPEPQPEPAPEAAPAEPEPQPEAAPVEPEPQPEAAPEEPAAVEPAPEAPAAEEPAAEPEMQTMQAEPEPAPEAAPAAEQAAPEAAPAPEAEPAPETAPQPEAPVEAQQAPEAAPEAAPEQAPAEEPAARSDIASSLTAQVDAYNAAVAELSAGGDTAGAQSRIDAALAEINAICANAGLPDVDSCLAPLGLSLNPLPDVQDVTPDAPAEGQPAAPADGTVDPNAPAAEGQVTVDGQPAEVIEDLPEGVTQEQIAPVLDSAKDVTLAPEGEAAPVEPAAADANAQAATEAEAAARVAPPENDEAAQSEQIRSLAVDATAMSATAEQGTEVTATENTTVNQTVVNNYITNITNITNNNSGTTNNTTINNNTTVVDNSQTNIGQQNNVTVVEQVPVREANASDLVTQVILQVGTQLIVNSIGQDTDRFYNPQQDEVYYENLPNGRVREVVSRPDGSQVVTVRNRNGDILRRSRITPDGREIVLAYFDDRYDDELLTWRDPGLDLPPLRLNIPVRDYVLDASYADENEVETFFRQPPVEQVQRLYSIDEVKRSARVRDSVRRLEVGNLTFDTGAATIDRDQVASLSAVANGMLQLLKSNPAETFLIEGHTDAVGSDIANLRLSDLRAATVARILTDFYGVPPENLATQGYGERYLKIRTESAERENRRVTIRRITPLITVAAN